MKTIPEILEIAQNLPSPEEGQTLEKITDTPFYAFKLAGGDYGYITTNRSHPSRGFLELADGVSQRVLAPVVKIIVVKNRSRKPSLKNVKAVKVRNL